MHNPFKVIVAPDPAPTPTTAASCKELCHIEHMIPTQSLLCSSKSFSSVALTPSSVIV